MIDARDRPGLPHLVVWAWPASVSSWASNGYNRSSLAIGVAGRFPELERHRTPVHSLADDFAAGLAAALAVVAAELPGQDRRQTPAKRKL